jgi:formylglycine-generating enzyme required for sulfatase activity
MKRVLIVVAVSFLLCSTANAQGGGGESTKTDKTTPKPTVTKPTTANRKPTTSRPASNFRPQNPHIELVRIPPGTFMMGSTDGGENEKPVHQVTITYSFYTGKYEVTRAEWQAVMGNNPSYFNDSGGANYPVENVSWNDAQEFIRKLNQMNDGYRYRLPTEAEWEYSCRAGTTGDYAGDVNEMGWYYDEKWGAGTHAVGQKQPNPWGLADMHGNVLEWCEDWYHETYYSAPTDGSAWLSGGEQKFRVLRGGSWGLLATWARSASRSFNAPAFRYAYNGFRVVAVR